MQKTIIEKHAILKLGKIALSKAPNKNIFIVTGKKSFENSGAKAQIMSELKDFNIVRFSDFQTNPQASDLVKGLTLFRESKAELIISVGGGSVMDMGKLINYYGEGKNLDRLLIGDISNSNSKLKPHIAIPTTAGSGSEATHFAVLYINNEKFSIANDTLIPNFALIDPLLQISQTPYQKAVSGIDALAQAIESVWSINATEESIGFALKAIELIWHNLHHILNDMDVQKHLNVALGANYAGKAINISKTTACHALSYPLSTQYSIPHGQAVALSLPHFMAFNYALSDENCMDERGADNVKKRIEKIFKILDVSNHKEAQLKLVHFIENIGLKSNLNIDIELIAPHINHQRAANNPRRLLESDIKQILRAINA